MVLVIGYGNTLRRDDGAGVVLVERMAQAIDPSAVCFTTAHQLTPELAQEIAEQEPNFVVFADAAVKEADHPARAVLQKLSLDASPLGMGHHLNPQAVMACARLLFGAHADAWVLSLPGFDFGHGEGLSDKTRAGVSHGEDLLRVWLCDLA